MGWIIGPATSPSTLANSLVAQGFIYIADNAGMALDLQRLNDRPKTPPKFVIKRINAEAYINTWCQVVYTRTGGMPGLVAEVFEDMYTCLGSGTDTSTISYYLGLLNGEAVATSMLMCGAGVAGIYNVATIPEAQRKGFGSAMTLTALREARSLGYRSGILHSTEVGYKVYLRLGFQEYCKLGLYVWTGGGAA
jgi:GNAT superfamily N-acetyltransferase